ncbi:CBS domain-containing protein [Roseivivax sp. CAU 1753]
MRRTVADAMTRDPVTVSPDMTLAHIVDQIVLRHWIDVLPVVEDGHLLGKLDSNVLSGIERSCWDVTRANDIFIGLSDDRLLSPPTGLAVVLDLIARTGQRKFLVAEGHRLLGVITLGDLTEYLPPA